MGGRASFFWRSWFRSQTVGSQITLLLLTVTTYQFVKAGKYCNFSLLTFSSFIRNEYYILIQLFCNWQLEMYKKWYKRVRKKQAGPNRNDCNIQRLREQRRLWCCPRSSTRLPLQSINVMSGKTFVSPSKKIICLSELRQERKNHLTNIIPAM